MSRGEPMEVAAARASIAIGNFQTALADELPRWFDRLCGAKATLRNWGQYRRESARLVLESWAITEDTE